MKRIDKITIEYDLDSILRYHCANVNGKTMYSGAALREEKPVREWYMTANPTDELGESINENLSWYDLFDGMRNGVGVYDLLGVHDSIMRERCFFHLAYLLVVPYDVVYKLWLHD